MQAALNVTEPKGGYSFCPVTRQRVHNGREFWNFEKHYADELIPICKLSEQHTVAKISAVAGNLVLIKMEVTPDRIQMLMECSACKADSISVCASDLEKVGLKVARLWITMQGPITEHRQPTTCVLSISTEEIPAFESIEKIEFYTKDSNNKETLIQECAYQPDHTSGKAAECGYGFNPLSRLYCSNGRRSFKFDITEQGLVPIHKIVFPLFSSITTTLHSKCDDLEVKNVKRLSDRLIILMRGSIGRNSYVSVSGYDLGDLGKGKVKHFINGVERKVDQETITLWLTVEGCEETTEKRDFALHVSTTHVPAFARAKTALLKTIRQFQEVLLTQVDLTKP